MTHKPPELSHTAWTLELLKAGWITSMECAQRGGCLSLSQRVGQFKRRGWDIRSVWTDTPGGARVLLYHCLGKVKGA